MATELNVALQIDARADIDALQKTIDELKAAGGSTEDLERQLQALTAELNRLEQEAQANGLDSVRADAEQLRDQLNATSAEQTKKINEQDKQLHRAYYCFGTKKELKDQNILTGGGLFSKSKMAKENFNEDYFISIDTREVTSIPLYARKATVRSSHPENSYRFVKDAEGNLTLEIVNAKSFWSMSKYLVVEVG